MLHFYFVSGTTASPAFSFYSAQTLCSAAHNQPRIFHQIFTFLTQSLQGGAACKKTSNLKLAPCLSLLYICCDWLDILVTALDCSNTSLFDWSIYFVPVRKSVLISGASKLNIQMTLLIDCVGLRLCGLSVGGASTVCCVGMHVSLSSWVFCTVCACLCVCSCMFLCVSIKNSDQYIWVSMESGLQKAFFTFCTCM